MRKGKVCPDSTLQLTLMIDLKTEAASIIIKIVERLELFPELICVKGLEIFVSGNVLSPG